MTSQPNMAPSAPAPDVAIQPDTSAPDPKLAVVAPTPAPAPAAPADPKKI